MTRTIYRHGESSSFASPCTSGLQGLTEVNHAWADRAFTWPVAASTFCSARNTQIICIARFYNVGWRSGTAHGPGWADRGPPSLQVLIGINR